MPKAHPETVAKEFGEEAFSFAADMLKTWTNAESGWLSDAAQAWSSETRRQIEDMSAHNMRALQQLTDCKSPFDIMKVEQEWMASRSKAMFEASVRMAKLFADATQAMGNFPAGGARR